MNRNSNLLFAGLFLLFQQGPIKAADSAPPDRVAYQGYLVDGNGDPLGNSVPANYDVVFRIYNVKQGGTTDNILWAEQQTVTVDKGYFSVLLGEGSAEMAEIGFKASSSAAASPSMSAFCIVSAAF